MRVKGSLFGRNLGEMCCLPRYSVLSFLAEVGTESLSFAKR